jgi:hypothetical protein
MRSFRHGQTGQAVALAEHAMAATGYLGAPAQARGMARYNLACAYAAVGRLDGAAEAVEAAVALNTDLVANAERDPELAAVRDTGDSRPSSPDNWRNARDAGRTRSGDRLLAIATVQQARKPRTGRNFSVGGRHMCSAVASAGSGRNQPTERSLQACSGHHQPTEQSRSAGLQLGKLG